MLTYTVHKGHAEKRRLLINNTCPGVKTANYNTMEFGRLMPLVQAGVSLNVKLELSNCIIEFVYLYGP